MESLFASIFELFSGVFLEGILGIISGLFGVGAA
jgi:hypothetical protein